jgi:predicted MFS family arabinose efflux permease
VALRGSDRFRRLALYLWALHFATHVSTPFFVPYMLDDLHWSYARIGLLLAVPAVVKILTVRAWGRIADRFGPGPLLRLAGWLVMPVPALWIVSESPWWILVAQAASGLSWGAFEVAQASALLQVTRGRSGAIGVFNLIDGSAILAGSLVGGVVVGFARGFGGSGYIAALLASAVLRLFAAGTLLRRVRGIGRPDWRHNDLPLRLWAFRPSRGFSLRPWGGPLRPDADDKGNDAHGDESPVAGRMVD